MEAPVVTVGGAVEAPTGGTMAAAADAVVEELMAMGAPEVVNEPSVGQEALKPDDKAPLDAGSALELPAMENDENFLPNSHQAGGEGDGEDHNFPVRINMDKIRRLQSSLPVDDPLAPLGSTKNPIRIIQQGNQFITTQDLTDDQLKQILQVLRNQALIEDGTETITSNTNSVYNPETSTRIIFRVTNANRALARAQVEEAGGSYPDYRHRPRKRPRTDGGSDSSDPDFDPGVPDEELGPLQPRRKTRALRPVRPPKHLVKDYKHIRVSEMDKDFREEESDGGYSDFDARANEEDRNDADWMPEAESETDAEPAPDPEWPCTVCGQVFNTKSGVSRHQFMKHGIRVMKPKMDMLSSRKAREMMPLAVKRRNKLKQALSVATDDDIMELVVPKLAKTVSAWDFLLARSESGSPGLPSITKLLADYMNLHDVFRSFVADHLQPCNISEEVEDPEAAEQPIYVKIDNEEHSQLLHLPCGEYRVKMRLNEAFLPSVYKNVLAMIDLQRERQKKTAWLLEQRQQQQQQQTENGQTAQSEGAVGIETLGPESLAALASAPTLITDEDLTSGRYLAVLNENGEATDLVLHAGSSLLYHRPSGQQVILLEDGSAATVVPADEVSAAALESGAVALDTLAFDSNLISAKPASSPLPAEKVDLEPLTAVEEVAQTETPIVLESAEGPAEGIPVPETNTKTKKEGQEVCFEEMMEEANGGEPEVEHEEEEEQEVESPAAVRRKATEGRRRGKVKKAAALKFEDKEDHTITQRTAPPEEEAPAPTAELGLTAEQSGEPAPMAMDVTQLFPGVNVTDIDENTMLIDRGDGRKIQVDHGGHGVTLETFQNLLTLP